MRRSCTIINIIIYILLGRIPQQFWITTALVLLFAVANLTQHHGCDNSNDKKYKNCFLNIPLSNKISLLLDYEHSLVSS